MKVEETKLENGKTRMDALASPAEVNHAFTVAKYQFLHKMKIEVRPGKTPDQLAGEALGVVDLSDVVARQAAEYLVPFVLDKHGFIPAFMPKGEFTTVPRPNTPFEFSVVATPKPAYELSDYDPVEITFEEIEIPTQAIEDQIKLLLQSKAEYVSVSDRPVKEGDGVVISMSAQRNGVPINALETNRRTYVVGMNLLSKDFDDQLLGMNIGEQKSFTLKVSEESEALSAAVGASDVRSIEVSVSVKDIQEKHIPELTDEWVNEQFPVLSGVEALVESIKETLIVQAETKEKQQKLELAVLAATKRFDAEIDAEVMIETKRALIENTSRSVQAQGMTFEFFVEQQGGEQAFAEAMTNQAREILVRGYTLDAVFRHFKLKVTDQDVKETCQGMGKGDAKTALRMMEDNGQGFLLREASERHVASKFLLNQAIVHVAE